MENELEGLDERAQRAVAHLDARLSGLNPSQEPIDPSYWAHARAELLRLTQREKELERENAELREWQRRMVVKAAAKSLDGYRELGARAERAESELAALRSKIAGCTTAQVDAIGSEVWLNGDDYGGRTIILLPRDDADHPPRAREPA